MNSRDLRGRRSLPDRGRLSAQRNTSSGSASDVVLRSGSVASSSVSSNRSSLIQRPVSHPDLAALRSTQSSVSGSNSGLVSGSEVTVESDFVSSLRGVFHLMAAKKTLRSVEEHLALGLPILFSELTTFRWKPKRGFSNINSEFLQAYRNLDQLQNLDNSLREFFLSFSCVHPAFFESYTFQKVIYRHLDRYGTIYDILQDELLQKPVDQADLPSLFDANQLKQEKPVKSSSKEAVAFVEEFRLRKLHSTAKSLLRRHMSLQPVRPPRRRQNRLSAIYPTSESTSESLAPEQLTQSDNSLLSLQRSQSESSALLQGHSDTPPALASLPLIQNLDDFTALVMQPTSDVNQSDSILSPESVNNSVTQSLLHKHVSETVTNPNNEESVSSTADHQEVAERFNVSAVEQSQMDMFNDSSNSSDESQLEPDNSTDVQEIDDTDGGVYRPLTSTELNQPHPGQALLHQYQQSVLGHGALQPPILVPGSTSGFVPGISPSVLFTTPRISNQSSDLRSVENKAQSATISNSTVSDTTPSTRNLQKRVSRETAV